jgi:hypothetical protein
VASEKGRVDGGREQNRWHDLFLYRTAGKEFVIVISFQTHWQGEQDYAEAHDYGPAGIVKALRDYDPQTRCMVYIPQGIPESRQREWAQPVGDLVRRYREQVRRLLAQFDEFDETLD